MSHRAETSLAIYENTVSQYLLMFLVLKTLRKLRSTDNLFNLINNTFKRIDSNHHS